ncbi:MAG: ribonuclease P protein component [Erysipelotrichaceae bacterium]|nr:ribonuclease P protein component [Erysipelotrichaceae bacterium]MDY3830213.1 ribonuclease P protein component [Erysipelotrichaceae bacterium]MDY5727766.1 ribonuclease P protein component [Erysipelotrichaceae bacterium]
MKKENRIKKNEEFQSIIKHNKSKSNRYYVLYYANRKHDYDRIGISVGKKSGNAVVRNKIKRQVRMMLQELCDFNSGYDYILIIRKNYDISQYQQNKKELSLLYNSVYNKQGQTFTKEN